MKAGFIGLCHLGWELGQPVAESSVDLAEKIR
jgi:hypothetical protein